MKVGVNVDIGWKVVSAGVGLVAGAVANRVVDVAWKAALGKESPKSDDIEVPIVEVVAFAVVSAGVATLVSQLCQRKAAQWYGPVLDRAQA
ncbi:DUF4235 domain-containing protein [Actinobaculum suis]|uniref:DUF4235 domain-containing protein n=1 Tax=Actinobaculum suis TaxID=1657 RepID=UPI0021005DBA|nr:DUF4235 domain-containing protein [Actinobaculum suis]